MSMSLFKKKIIIIKTKKFENPYYSLVLLLIITDISVVCQTQTSLGAS